jgi:hypothetical protein
VAAGTDGAVVGELHAYLRRSRTEGGSEVVLEGVEVLAPWRGLGRLVDELRRGMARAGVTTARAVLTLTLAG